MTPSLSLVVSRITNCFSSSIKRLDLNTLVVKNIKFTTCLPFKCVTVQCLQVHSFVHQSLELCHLTELGYVPIKQVPSPPSPSLALHHSTLFFFFTLNLFFSASFIQWIMHFVTGLPLMGKSHAVCLCCVVCDKISFLFRLNPKVFIIYLFKWIICFYTYHRFQSILVIVLLALTLSHLWPVGASSTQPLDLFTQLRVRELLHFWDKCSGSSDVFPASDLKYSTFFSSV